MLIWFNLRTKTLKTPKTIKISKRISMIKLQHGCVYIGMELLAPRSCVFGPKMHDRGAKKHLCSMLFVKNACARCCKTCFATFCVAKMRACNAAKRFCSFYGPQHAAKNVPRASGSHFLTAKRCRKNISAPHARFFQ